MGEKPLFLLQGDGFLFFCSELQALLKSNLIKPELDPIAINNYFYYRFIPEPRTPIKGVSKLSPGNFLSVSLAPWTQTTHQYWNLCKSKPLEGDPIELVRSEIEEIGRIIVRSDVPIGVSLSGGFDSSAVASLAMKHCPEKVQAFCVGYSGRPDCDERRDAGTFARYLGLPLQEIELAPHTVVDIFPELISKMNEPIADISAFGYLSVMKAANQAGIRVLLLGQGADELFWGYSWMLQALSENLAKQKPGSWLQKLSNAMRAEFYPLPYSSPRALARWAIECGGLRLALARFTRTNNSNPNQLIFFDVAKPFHRIDSFLKTLYSKDMREAGHAETPYDVFCKEDTTVRPDIRLIERICRTYLLENGISQADRYSMAESVEVRLPFVDYKLAETVIGIRKSHHVDSLLSKDWLKESVGDLVPDWVRTRPKRGFSPPSRTWLKILHAAYSEDLSGGYLEQAGILSQQGARQLASPSSRFERGLPDLIRFQAQVLEAWCRNNLSI
jgi:asparagine synthase (glutamine-hydrolysing)